MTILHDEFGNPIKSTNPMPTTNLINDAIPVTPNDDADLAIKPTRGLYVGVSGDVVVITANGSTAIFKSLAAGVIHPISVTRIKATGTAATSIMAMY